MFRTLFSYALLLLCPAFVNAAELVYSTTSSDNGSYGTGKAEVYDVAVHITDAGFIGKAITAIEIPVRENAAISDYSVFLTKELKLESKVNAPDIVSVSATTVDGKLRVTFDEPYTVTAEGVFVGYSLTVSSVKDAETSAPTAPLVGEYKSGNNEFWIHTKRTYVNWMDKSSLSFTPSITITFSGDFAANAAGITLKSGLKGVSKGESTITATIANYGSEPINNIDVDYQVGDKSGSAHVDLAEPIAAQYALSQDIELEIPTEGLRGTKDLTLKVAKVNGSDNVFEYATATADITFYSFVPKHRAVMEEYTGTWCGWCPRGFAAMQYLNKHYEDFIGIAYHSDDIMQCYSSVPNNPGSYPSCRIDRQSVIDPYYGTSSSFFNIENDWLARCEEIAPADIDLEAWFDSPESDNITVNTTVTFCTDITDADYKLAYVLVADDLYSRLGTTADNRYWRQSNYYTGYDPSDYISELQPFCEGASYVEGLHFDDVVIYGPDVLGIEGSIPSTITDSEPIEWKYTIDSSQAQSAYASSYSLLQDRTKLRVVAMLLDADGIVVNANQTKVYGGVDGVNSVAVPDAKVVATDYFDLSGRRVINPENGLYIRRTTRSDGTVSTDKLLIK